MKLHLKRSHHLFSEQGVHGYLMKFASPECDEHVSLYLNVRNPLARVITCWFFEYTTMEGLCWTRCALGAETTSKNNELQKEYNITHIAGSHPVCEIAFLICTCTTWPQRGNTIALGLFSFVLFFRLSPQCFYSSKFPCFMFSVVTCRNTSLFTVAVGWFNGKERYCHSNYSKYLVTHTLF